MESSPIFRKEFSGEIKKFNARQHENCLYHPHMRTLLSRVTPLALCVWIVGCSTPRELPRYETPIARTQYQRVRTTAYTETESDHLPYSNHNALGSELQCGPVHSAAADWSRWPAGTIFRIRETGELYRVDDYGWALVAGYWQ